MRTNLSRNRPGERELRAGEQLWGARPDTEARHPEKPRMRLLAWRKINTGNLIGVADIELPIGLKIFGVAVLRGSAGLWAALPSRPQLDRDKRQTIGADGKATFAAVAEWRTRELQDRFSTAVVELVRKEHPGDIGEPE